MTTESKFARMDTKVRAFLASQFATAPIYQAELLELWTIFLALKLPNDDFLAEFTNGKKPSLAQRTWEMLLAKHLHNLGHKVACPNGGPDFRFELKAQQCGLKQPRRSQEGSLLNGSIQISQAFVASPMKRCCSGGHPHSIKNGKRCRNIAANA